MWSLCYGILFLAIHAVASESHRGQLGYGANCSKPDIDDINFEKDYISDPCKSALECNDHTNTCGCSHHTTYNKELDYCVPHIGEPCQPNGKCPSNATCSEWPTMFPDHIHKMWNDYENQHRHTQWSSVPLYCLCDRGFRHNVEATTCIPALQYEDKCSEELAMKNITCDVELGMNCSSSGTCKCLDPSIMIYNPTMHRCVVKVGGPCGDSKFMERCDRNSVCPNMLSHLRMIAAKVLRNDRYRFHPYYINDIYNSREQETKTCACLPGYVQNSKGKCVASFHVPCSTESPCDKEKFLACVGGICQCERGSIEVFEGEEMTCKLLLGTSCANKKGPKCMKNAVCKKTHCECAEGFSDASLTSCLSNYGSKCSASSFVFCNNARGLSCIDSKCACFDPTFKWNSKMKMCTADEGEICGKFNLNLTDGAEQIKMEDELYPHVSSLIPSFYYIGCEEGLKCTTEYHAWGPGLSHCKKGATNSN